MTYISFAREQSLFLIISVSCPCFQFIFSIFVYPPSVALNFYKNYYIVFFFSVFINSRYYHYKGTLPNDDDLIILILILTSSFYVEGASCRSFCYQQAVGLFVHGFLFFLTIYKDNIISFLVLPLVSRGLFAPDLLATSLLPQLSFHGLHSGLCMLSLHH